MPGLLRVAGGDPAVTGQAPITGFVPLPQELKSKMRFLLSTELELIMAVLDESWRWGREWTPPRSNRDWAKSTDMTEITCRRALRVLVRAGVLQRDEESTSNPSGQRFRLERGAIPRLTKEVLQALRVEVQAPRKGRRKWEVRDRADQGILPGLDHQETQVTERPGSPGDLGHQVINPPDLPVIRPPDLLVIRVENVENPPGGAPVAAIQIERQVPLKPEETIQRPSSPETTEGKPLDLPRDDLAAAPLPGTGPEPVPPVPDPEILSDEEINRRVDHIARIVRSDIKPHWVERSRKELKYAALRSAIWKSVSEGKAIHEMAPEFIASLLVDGCLAFLQKSTSISVPTAFANQWYVRLKPLEESLKRAAAERALMAAKRAEGDEIRDAYADDAWRARSKENFQRLRAVVAAGGVP